MLYTDSTKLEKVMKKEAMLRDIQKKVEKQKESEKHYFPGILSKISTGKSVELNSDIGGLSNSPKGGHSSGIKGPPSHPYESQGDYLPFTELILPIARLLPGFPKEPTLNLTLSKEHFMDVFAKYSKSVRRDINKKLRGGS